MRPAGAPDYGACYDVTRYYTRPEQHIALDDTCICGKSLPCAARSELEAAADDPGR